MNTNRTAITLTEKEYMKQYLQRASELEYDRYQLEQLGKKMQNELQFNDTQQQYLLREKNNLRKRADEIGSKANSNPQSVRMGDVVAGTFAFALGIFAATVVESFLGFGIVSIVATILEKTVGMNFTMLALFVVIPFILSYFRQSSEVDKGNSEYHSNMKKQRDGLTTEAGAKDAQLRRLKTARAAVEREAARCSAKLAELNRAREQYYNNGVLHKKYRSLVPTAMMYEYFDTRICDKLEGADGAISRYEYQVRIDHISETVDGISNKLNTVIRNQAMILNRVEEINSKMDDVISGIHNLSANVVSAGEAIERQTAKIAENTKLTKYYSEVTARCSHYLAWKEGYCYNRYL